MFNTKAFNYDGRGGHVGSLRAHRCGRGARAGIVSALWRASEGPAVLGFCKRSKVGSQADRRPGRWRFQSGGRRDGSVPGGSAPGAVAESETVAVEQGGLRVRTCVGTLCAWGLAVVQRSAGGRYPGGRYPGGRRPGQWRFQVAGGETTGTFQVGGGRTTECGVIR